MHSVLFFPRTELPKILHISVDNANFRILHIPQSPFRKNFFCYIKLGWLSAQLSKYEPMNCFVWERAEMKFPRYWSFTFGEQPTLPALFYLHLHRSRNRIDGPNNAVPLLCRNVAVKFSRSSNTGCDQKEKQQDDEVARFGSLAFHKGPSQDIKCLLTRGTSLPWIFAGTFLTCRDEWKSPLAFLG